MENRLCYCTNVSGLFTFLGFPHNPSDRRLFIDSSKRSLKAVLLHKGNKYPSIPIAHSVHLKEFYDNMELLLEAVKYNLYQWSLCRDLKVIGLLMSMQAGFTKYCCFLCLWKSQAVSKHYKQKDWVSRSTFVPGEHGVQENPLVDMKKVLLPPLQIKLGLLKNFVKAMDKNGAAFQHLCTLFPALSSTNLKEDIFIGPQIWEVLKYKEFEELLTLKELIARETFKSVCHGFLGNIWVLGYQEYIEILLQAYEDMGCWMSLKIHFLHFHLNFFPPNLRAVNDEQGERFHQDINKMESNYKLRQVNWGTSTGCSYVTSRRQSIHEIVQKTHFWLTAVLRFVCIVLSK